MSIEARMAGIEARMAALEAKLAGGAVAPSNGGGQSSGGGELQPLPDAKLDAEWADKTVAKDPKRWTGESMVGRRYSDCPAEWHDENASFHAWKAKKGREENPPRLKNNGKPWYEADEFTAKLSMAWARRIRSRSASHLDMVRGGSVPASSSPTNEVYDDPAPADDDGEIPFASTVDRSPRHVRRRVRWEKW